jgi:hypothetical protein
MDDDFFREHGLLYASRLCHGLCWMRTEEKRPKHNAQGRIIVTLSPYRAHLSLVPRTYWMSALLAPSFTCSAMESPLEDNPHRKAPHLLVQVNISEFTARTSTLPIGSLSLRSVLPVGRIKRLSNQSR